MDEVQTPSSLPSAGERIAAVDAADGLAAADTADAVADDTAAAPPPASSGPRRGIGVLALVLAVFLVTADIVAVVIGATPDAANAVVPAVTALGFSALALAVGLVASIADRGRTLGVIAAVLAVVLNPFLFTQALGWLGSL